MINRIPPPKIGLKLPSKITFKCRDQKYCIPFFLNSVIRKKIKGYPYDFFQTESNYLSEIPSFESLNASVRFKLGTYTALMKYGKIWIGVSHKQF